MPNAKLLLHIDFRSGLPIYTQIVNQIQAQVVGGVLKPGDQLPTVRALAEELTCQLQYGGAVHIAYWMKHISSPPNKDAEPISLRSRRQK